MINIRDLNENMNPEFPNLPWRARVPIFEYILVEEIGTGTIGLTPYLYTEKYKIAFYPLDTNYRLITPILIEDRDKIKHPTVTGSEERYNEAVTSSITGYAIGVASYLNMISRYSPFLSEQQLTTKSKKLHELCSELIYMTANILYHNKIKSHNIMVEVHNYIHNIAHALGQFDIYQILQSEVYDTVNTFLNSVDSEHFISLTRDEPMFSSLSDNDENWLMNIQ